MNVLIGFINLSTEKKFQFKEILQIILKEILCREKSYEFYEESIIEKSFELLALSLQKFKSEFFSVWRENKNYLKNFTGNFFFFI